LKEAIVYSIVMTIGNGYTSEFRKRISSAVLALISTESSPCPRAKPSGRGGHRVLWFGCRRAGNSLSGFKGAVIFQKIRDAGRAE